MFLNGQWRPDRCCWWNSRINPSSQDVPLLEGGSSNFINIDVLVVTAIITILIELDIVVNTLMAIARGDVSGAVI